MEIPIEELVRHLSIIPDPRVDRTKHHPLESILFIAICAILSGAEHWVEMEEFGNTRKEWLSRFIDVSAGIPSHDTFGRVFAQLDPLEFQKSFLSWVRAVSLQISGQIVSIDGKTLRRSHDQAKGIGPLHLVSAWAQGSHLVLGQVKTEEASNEIEAIPRLLEMLHLKNCIVTLDAIGTQKTIAQKLQTKKADYVLALKGNHGLLHDDIKTYWEDPGLPESEYQAFETTDKDHGRLETRRYRITDQLQWLTPKQDWPGLKTIGMVQSERIIGDQKTVQRRYYLSSLGPNAQEFARAVRAHWEIENQLHWSLDVSFREDQCRVRVKHAAENFALLRRIALHLLKKDTSSKKSINRKRFRAALDPAYLEVILGKI